MSDYKTPRTQADLDGLTAEDVSRLESIADLAAAFARLVARRQVSVFERTCGFPLEDVIKAIRNRGWGFDFGTADVSDVKGPIMASVHLVTPDSFIWGTSEHSDPDPARALMSAAVLAAIAERDAR